MITNTTIKFYITTRIHSSRMRTARSLPYRGRVLCPEGGGLSREGLCPGGLCPGGGSLSMWWVSVQVGSICPGGSLSGEVSVQVVGLCPGGGSLSRWWVSVQVGSICPGGEYLSRGVSVWGGLCPGGGSLSRWWVSVQVGSICPGGSLSRGVSVQGISVRNTPSSRGQTDTCDIIAPIFVCRW